MKLYKGVAHKVKQFYTDNGKVFQDQIREPVDYQEAALSDIRKAAVDLGHAVVPLEPTDKMIDSLIQERDSCGSCTMTENYKAMIQAAQEV